MMIYAFFQAVKDHIYDYFRMRRLVNEAAASKKEQDSPTKKERA